MAVLPFLTTLTYLPDMAITKRKLSLDSSDPKEKHQKGELLHDRLEKEKYVLLALICRC